MHLKIAVLPGDYIGPEVMAAALPVLEAVLKKSGHTLEHSTHDVGGAGIDNHGKALPDSTLEACRAADAILFGSVGGPKWEKLPPAEQPERASLLPLRKHFTLYANVRPGLLLKNLIDTSPIRPDRIPNGVDMVCIRELTGGLYFGPKSTTEIAGGDIEAIDTMVYRRSEVERILKVAIETARGRKGKLCSVDKANVLENGVLWRKTVVEIAKQYLVPKQREAHGLKLKDIIIKPEIIEKVIEDYTRESGVRGLEKKIATLIRGTAKCVAVKEKYNKTLNNADVLRILGAAEYDKDMYQGNDVAGVVTGLAWTSVGGDILFIEASLSPGKGKLTLTGSLGDVMKESAVIAMEYLKAHSHLLGLKQELFDRHNIHVHVPEGATPKDGPSAGITMLTSLASVFTQRKVKKHLAMTGEITLRGDVLPVGGIKEKILAAKRANIKEIILCYENKSDIEEIKSEYIEGLTFHYVKEMSEVIDVALTNQKVKNAKKL